MSKTFTDHSQAKHLGNTNSTPRKPGRESEVSVDQGSDLESTKNHGKKLPTIK